MSGKPGRKTGMENRDGKDYTIPIMLAAAPGTFLPGGRRRKTEGKEKHA